MSLLQEIQNESNGAQFRRADLHIHSFGEGGSYDVKDATMTPEGIVDTAIAERLDLIAITDHNQIANISPALKYADGKRLLVLANSAPDLPTTFVCQSKESGVVPFRRANTFWPTEAPISRT